MKKAFVARGVVAIAVISLNLLFNPLVAKGEKQHDHHHGHGNEWHAIKEGVCVVRPTQGNRARGIVRFSQVNGETKVTANIIGLSPNGKHAIHVHQYGDCTSPDGKSAGGHYDPEGRHTHALPGNPNRHAGDLGNLQADADGRARFHLVVNNLSIAGTKNPVLGRAIIIHAKEDDGGEPTGNAGPRIACGVIGVAKPSVKKTHATTAPTTQPK